MEEDDDGNEIENQDLRRLYYQLTCHEIGRPMLDEKDKEKDSTDVNSTKPANSFWSRFFGNKENEEDEFKANCNSLIYRALMSTNTKSRDLILEISTYLEAFSLSRHLISQTEIAHML